MDTTSITNWAAREFGHPIPQDYLSFLAACTAADSCRSYFITDTVGTLELSKWFAPSDIPTIYRACLAEELIEECMLPILDSCGCVMMLNCDDASDTYGQALLQAPEGCYDEKLQKNTYAEPILLAQSFSELVGRQVGTDYVDHLDPLPNEPTAPGEQQANPVPLSQEDIARSVAERAHRRQVDKAGNPYIEHPAHVAAHVEGDAAKASAWLHDVVEDTPYTFEDLEALGISGEVLDALHLLTHDPAVPYFEYVRRIKENPVARAVKLADLRHNSDLSRLPKITDADLQRRQKYEHAIEILL